MLFWLKKTLKNNKIFFGWLTVFIILEILSWLAFSWPQSSLYILIVLASATAVLVFKKPIFALYLPIGELAWGSLGHSISYNFLSFRLIIFLIILFIFLIKNLLRLNKLKFNKIWLIILFLVFLGILRADAGSSKVFLDANAYFYLLYLPIWQAVYDKKYLNNILIIILAAITIVAFKTLITFYIFSQFLQNIDNDFYRWIRDTRVGEITLFQHNFYRIFLQSQIYILFAWIYLVYFKKYRWLAILFAAALFISLSRSFWVGWAIAGLILLFFNFKKLAWPILFSLIGGIVAVEILWNIPHFNNFNFFTARVIDTQESAASSRAAQLGPLFEAIKAEPVLGHGFGKELTYQSSDPRHPGDYTTYAFEWGWLDMWLKGGVLLVGSFVAWLVMLIKQVGKNAVFLAIIIALAVIHVFTPYLNHPLGLGPLMLLSVILNNKF